MTLEIVSVLDQGDPEMEHILLKATAHCSLGHFLLADGRRGPDLADTTRVCQTYWFPDTEINAGDYVSLWTKRGKNTTDAMEDGTPVHRFFWNLPAPVWTHSGDCALLFDLRAWKCFRVNEN
jgi:hypothetical protein